MTDGSRKAILAAFLANMGIAITKFVGFLLTGSASLLAETVHSIADTGNQALLFLGGPVLRGFSEALLIGIIAGTYSSIYISSSVALDFGLKAEHVFPTVKKTAVDHLP